MPSVRLLATTLFLFAVAGFTSAQSFQAIAAQGTITPETLRAGSVYLAGFGHNRIATGVHDDLYTRGLALRISTQTLILSSADLIGLFYDDVLAIRRTFEKNVPGQRSWWSRLPTRTQGPIRSASTGPNPLQSGIDIKYLDWVDQRIATTAAEAVRAMRPARLELARGRPSVTWITARGRPASDSKGSVPVRDAPGRAFNRGDDRDRGQLE